MPIDPQLYGGFVLAVILICVIPGPDMVFVVANGARHGRRAGVVAAFGIQGGMLVHTIAAVAGLSALVASSATAFETLRLAGAAYLLWLALVSLRRAGDAPRAEDRRQDRATSLARVLRQGALTNLLNPKIIVFFLAFVPQFVDWDRGHVAWQIAVLGGTFMAVGLAIDAVVGVLAARARHALARSDRVGRILERVAATVYVGLAARLVMEG
jgi:threonine/homoserine/homoserine lactone efflux protein